MKFSIRDLLLVTLVVYAMSGCGNFSNGGGFNDTPSSVTRGQPILIKMRLVINGVGSSAPERSYSDEECFVRFDRSGDFQKLPLRRTVNADEVWVEATVTPKEYKDAELVQYYLRMKCDGVENRLPGNEVKINQPGLPDSSAPAPNPPKP